MESNVNTTIQIKKETRDLLRVYCKKHGYTMSKFLDILIREKVTTKLNITPPLNVLKTKI